MKFVFFGYDYSLDIAQRLVADGHELLRIFTFPCDGAFTFNTQTSDYAQLSNIPVTEEQIKQSDVDELLSLGCEIFLACGYPHKIIHIDESRAYGINLHPAYLPQGRGIMPLPHIIMHEPDVAGLSVHKMTQEFDSGDILYQEKITIDDLTDVEMISARIALKAPDVISRIIGDLQNYWDNSQKQDEGKASTFPVPDPIMRELNWNDDAKSLNLKGRGFGRYGTTATIKNNIGDTQKIAIFQFIAWQEEHNHTPGMLLRSSPTEIIITINGGYICIKDFRVI